MGVRVSVAVAVAVLATTTWVVVDSRKRDWGHDSFADAAWKWVLGCLLLWVVVFPLYLVRRGQAAAKDGSMPPPGRVTVIRRRNVPVFWWGIASAAAMALGAYGPWAKVAIVGFSVGGLDGSNDGWLVLGLAVLAALCVLGQHRYIGLVVIGCLAALGGLAIGVYDHYDIESTIDSTTPLGNVVVIGWGLNLVIAASLSAAVQAVAAARATEKLRHWERPPAERNVLVGRDGGLDIPYKATRWTGEQVSAASATEAPSPPIESKPFHVPPPAEATFAGSVTVHSVSTELERLSALRASGVLDEDEFRLAKARVLQGPVE